MIEELHRPLKSAIKCHATERWTEVLPIILLGLRASLKEDILCTPAELVFGTTIRLPGEMTVGSNTCFLRRDMLRRPLQQPYDGPFKVLQRKDKVFFLDINGKRVSVSIDRCKPAFFLNTVEPNATASTPATVEPNATPATVEHDPTASTPTQPSTRSGRKVHLPTRQIVSIAVTDRSVTPRTVAQPIECASHHSVSARAIRRHLQQSGLSVRRPLLGLPLTQNHRRLRRQWCDVRRMWAAEWNEDVFTDASRICLQHQRGRIRVGRHHEVRMLNSGVMHRHTDPAPGIMGLATAIFQQDNARPHVARIVQKFFVNHQIELLPWPAHAPDLSLIENMWSMVAQRLTQITPQAATPN
ncbi:transposable element Tcb1 transposase [Trichonephila clavipes]|nr:transposable element Tcb1 transposase [Trichonephila clavipes]